jgi:DNA-binding NtrC family response regulator
LPPLKERKEDIPLLVEAFLKAHESGHGSKDIETPVWTLLKAYDYPGNIRELKSIVQHAANLSRGKPITVHHLPTYVTSASPQTDDPAALFSPDTIAPLAAVEKDHIIRVYRHTCENKLQTARLLEISLNTLRRKLQSYGLE